MSIEGVRLSTDPGVVENNWRLLRAAVIGTGIKGGQVIYGGSQTGEALILHSNTQNDGSIIIGGTLVINEGPRYTRIVDCASVPAVNPISGGYLYSSAAVLYWRSAGGVVSVVAPSVSAAHRVKLRLSANQSITANTDTDVLWDVEDYDTDAYHPAGASASVTIPAGLGGLYSFWGHAIWTASTGSAAREIWVTVNGTEKHRNRIFSTASNATIHSVPGGLLLAAGDVVKMRVRQQDAAALLLNADADRTCFTLALVSA